MAPKKSAGAAVAKKSASAPSHPTYKDMIKETIIALKERNGSSRQAIKKYIMANHKNLTTTPAQFDQQFNKALRTGVEKGDFTQPKGASGPVKLAKKSAEPKKAAPAKKSGDAKPKKAAPKKASSAKPKASGPKKSAAPKKTAAKANTSNKRTKAADSGVKSGRVSKPKATKKAPAKKAAPKKAAA